MLLSELKEGEKGIIVKVRGYGSFKKRLSEMGFIRGKEVEVMKYAPLRDPIEYRILNYNVSLRSSEASMIEVVNVGKHIQTTCQYNGTISKEMLSAIVERKEKTIHIALVGNPNAGKTTFFNHASGSSERVGNYAGVTVSVKKAVFKYNGYKIEIADLPGTYSLTSFSPEERYVRDYLITEKPDIVVNLVDGSNLERNLFLTTQLIDMDLRVIMALNMYDELVKIGAKLDNHMLGQLIGIPVIPTISSKGKGIQTLLQRIVDVFEGRDTVTRHIHINYGKEVEDAIADIQKTINKDKSLVAYASPRFLSLKLLEGDKSLQPIFSESNLSTELQQKTEKHRTIIENIFNEDIDTVLTNAHYGFIEGALRECYTEKKKEKHSLTHRIDNILTNRVLGFPFFIIFMYVAFYSTFTIGAYPMEWIENGMGVLGTKVAEVLSAGPLRDLLVDGIIGGVGGVLVFLPNILILFFFISLMEDSGYMARAVFIMDKLMHKIGLHGRSFIPLVMGFGCNVPAVLATRALNNRKDRMITILINPFMSCSARLPVYILLIAAFFPNKPALILLLMYALGILMAVVMARIFRKVLFRSADVPFVMELPPYRMPTMRSLIKHMWGKAVHYLKKIGGVILIASIIIWALGYFPRDVEYSKDYSQLKEKARVNYEKVLDTNILDSEREEFTARYEANIEQLEYAQQEEELEKTYIGRLGHSIEPILRPLGFDWKIGVAILTGAAAKEIVVSTLGVLYQTGSDATEDDIKLQSKLKNATYTTGDKVGQPVYTPRVAFSLMLFVLIYFPCIGVISAVSKETGWKWGVFLALYTTALAYILSLIFYQISGLF